MRRRKCILAFLRSLVNLWTGEFLLKWEANSGTIVLLRAFWVTFVTSVTIVLLFLVVFLVRRLWAGHEAAVLLLEGTFELDAAFSYWVPWFATVFAGAYTALYARFSSQWQYLAGLYNQIKGAEVEAGSDGKSKPLASWKAGFIEDADDLHLACKPNFAAAIVYWLDDELVRKYFDEATVGGASRLSDIEERIHRALDAKDPSWRKEPTKRNSTVA